jgi:SAM-dependent methyltransferase
MNKPLYFIIPIVLLILGTVIYFAGQPKPNPKDEGLKLDVRFITTPMNVADQMLLLAEIKASDVLYDLGCGDGRIAIRAAKRFGIHCIGYDIDPERIKESRENAIKAGVEDLVQFEVADIFTLDLSKADVIMMYLLPELNVRLIPQLQQMKPGSRIVSNNFDMEGVEPVTDKVVQHIRNTDDPYEIYGENDKLDFSVIYLWRTPLKMNSE